MTNYYCLVSAKDAECGSNLGWGYCKAHKSEWIKGSSDTDDINTTGFVKGANFIVSGGKVYAHHKYYQDLDEKKVVILCIESVQGCDNITL